MMFFLLFIISIYIQDTNAVWPSINNSPIQLLGLFPDPENTSTPTSTSVHSRAMFKAAILLAQQYNITIQDEFIDWKVGQTDGNVINAISDTCQAITQSNILGIVGPAFSREADHLSAFAGSIGIPVISYGATDPSLSDRSAFPAFHRTIASDYAAAIAITKLFTRYNWTSTIIIYQNDAFGKNGANMILQALNDAQVVVTKTIAYDLSTKKIAGDLKTMLTTSSARVVILWMDAINAPVVIQSALDNDVLGPQFTWILSSIIPLNSFNRSYISKLTGMLTIEAVVGDVINEPINTTLLNDAYNLWQEYEPETFPGTDSVDYYALFTFDATWTFILSLQELCSSSSFCTQMTSASTCFDYRSSDLNSLMQTIDNISFVGVSGPIGFSSNSTDRTAGIYYIARNAQPSASGMLFTPVLQYVSSGDWTDLAISNVIIWPGSSLTAPTGRPLLEGVILKIAITQAIPFSMLTYEVDEFGRNTTKYIGYVPDLIAKLEYNMKFIPQLILPPSTKTYNQIIQDVANGVYDIFISDVTVTSTRRQMVDFSDTIFDNSLRLMTRKAQDEIIDLLGFLRTFTNGLWLVLLALGLVSAVLISLMERQDNEALQNRTIIPLAFMGAWFSLGVLVGYGVDFHVTTAAGRLLTAGLYVISLVFVATYTANLASYLTIKQVQQIVSGVDEVKQGKVPFNRIGIRPGSSFESYYLREISHGVKNYYPLSSSRELYSSLLSGATDITIIDSGVAEYMTNNVYCNLTLVGAEFERTTFGVAMPHNWIYAADLNENILSLRESGDLDDLRATWFQSKTCPVISNDSDPMGVNSLGGLFITFGAVSILALIVYFWMNRMFIKHYISYLIRRARRSIRK